MKKRSIMRLLMAVMLLGTCIGLARTENASASTYGTIPVDTVTDIDNVPYPATTTIYLFGKGYVHRSEFTIPDAGEVKLYCRWPVDETGRGTAWISRDAKGYDIVGKAVDIMGTNNYLLEFLDAGKYYINITWSEDVYDFGAAILYENAFTEETIAVSSIYNANLIQLNTLKRGFVASTSPNDFYVFTLDKKAMVKVRYSFDGEKNVGKTGYCTLYDVNGIQLKEGDYGTYTKGEGTYDILLEPGVYYIKMSGALGKTTIQVDPMYYDIKLTPAVETGWTKGPMDVTIDTTIDYSEIVVVSKNVSDADIKNTEIWQTYGSDWRVTLNGNSFQATKNGVYSVRIADKFGNYTIQRINVTTLDTTAPKVSGAADGKGYNKAVTIKWSDSQSGINTKKATLNGKVVKSGVKVSEEGKYTLKVYDKVGNVKKIVFYIDFTAPTVSGVANGKYYTGYVSFTFKDKLSGIKKVTVNDMEVPEGNTSYYANQLGKNVIKLWDKAGNYRKITFYIK